jgi:hypothetical protein
MLRREKSVRLEVAGQKESAQNTRVIFQGEQLSTAVTGAETHCSALLSENLNAALTASL